ncbi:hypothetical protein, partial [Micrococcus sp. F3Y]|uniref:hypothetical protein n=1 Tax=Micrococcus sp. F3Y TaxID=3402627 RepID=UPI003AF7160D
MSAKLDPAHLDHAIELYLAGKPLQEIQATSGVSLSRMHAERRARGIPPRGRRELPLDDVQQDYVLRTIEDRDVRFVRLWFTDVVGTLKSVALSPAEVE